MRAAKHFVGELDSHDCKKRVESITTKLYGSLASTGIGHGTDRAILLGLEGAQPETVDPDAVDARVEQIYQSGLLTLDGGHEISFANKFHMLFSAAENLPRHSNGICFTATDRDGSIVLEKIYYSVGGGFVVDEAGAPLLSREQAGEVPYPYRTAAELLSHAEAADVPISEIALRNELSNNSMSAVRGGLDRVWEVMQNCVTRGCARAGVLPGGLQVQRRAPALYQSLLAGAKQKSPDLLDPLDWVNVFALAVSEENAAGGQVVTAPTNGAAGIIPAVLHYYKKFCDDNDDKSDDAVFRFLLTAGAICSLYKNNASLSGAEVGCQGEVGVACSMAAGALAEVLGGSVLQVEAAAEIGMEHSLGLTCDPVGGLVQMPCIERNAVGAVKAIHAARLALKESGKHRISLDQVIETMRQTGADMLAKYKETSLGGLAVNVVEC